MLIFSLPSTALLAAIKKKLKLKSFFRIVQINFILPDKIFSPFKRMKSRNMMMILINDMLLHFQISMSVRKVR